MSEILMEKDVKAQLIQKNVLAKFGEYQWMSKLIHEGEIYMNSLLNFANIEETNGIGDEFENSISYEKYVYPNLPKLKLEGVKIPNKKISEIRVRSYPEENKGHIYSMSIVDIYKTVDDVLVPKYDKKMDEIGKNYDTMVLICNPDEFLRRIKCKVLEYKLYYSEVTYFSINEQNRIVITPFTKRDIYAYQREFRLFIQNDSVEPIKFNIGDIRDIAVLISSNK